MNVSPIELIVAESRADEAAANAAMAENDFEATTGLDETNAALAEAVAEPVVEAALEAAIDEGQAVEEVAADPQPQPET